MSERLPIYGLLAEFEQPAGLIEAAEAARHMGYRHMDAYTPLPLEELTEALGLPHSRLPMIVLAGGLIGCVGGYLLQYYGSVIGYPLNIGGRPLHSWPSFIPITFELTILCSALFVVLGMFALNGLPMPYHPLFNVPEFAMATRDRFFLCIEATDSLFDATQTREFLKSHGAKAIYEAPH